MVPSNIYFGPSHVKNVKNPNRNMHLEVNFCEDYCVQMKFSVPGKIGKCSWGKEHPFLTEFVLIMNSFFIQYNAPLVEYVNVAQEVNSLGQK